MVEGRNSDSYALNFLLRVHLFNPLFRCCFFVPSVFLDVVVTKVAVADVVVVVVLDCVRSRLAQNSLSLNSCLAH